MRVCGGLIVALGGCATAFGLDEVPPVPPPACAPGPDEDADEVPDACDSCPTVATVAEADSDGDGVGDACDPASDPAAPHRILAFEGFNTDLGALAPLLGSFTVDAGSATAEQAQSALLTIESADDLWIHVSGTVGTLPETRAVAAVGIWLRAGPIPDGGTDFTGYLCNVVDIHNDPASTPSIDITRERGADAPELYLGNAVVGDAELFTGERFALHASVTGGATPAISCDAALDGGAAVTSVALDRTPGPFTTGWAGVRSNRMFARLDYVFVVAR